MTSLAGRLSRINNCFQLAYLIARAAICNSASLSLQCRRKQSDTAAIKNGLLALGREPMNSATVIALSSIRNLFNSLGIALPPEKFCQSSYNFHLTAHIIS